MRRAVRAIIIRDGKLLVMQRDKFGHPPYYTLPGGGIDAGETAEQALKRELQEECSFTLTAGQQVFTEEAHDPYGTQYIYVCEAIGEEPRLHPGSDEAHIHQMGQNLYTPQWLPLGELSTVEFLSVPLRQGIMYGIRHGFPTEVKVLDNAYIRHITEEKKND
jgi:ADP-ribose pyrophosphatase YjhB (NUDIX family)